MSIRIQLRNLPGDHTPREAYWEIVWFLGHAKFKSAVREGESWIGSSPRADIRIQAAGVRSRHLRIKRNGDRIFIQPVGESTVVRDGQMLQDFTPIPAGAQFLFGSVTASLSRVEPGDCLNAVPMDVAPASSVTAINGAPQDRCEALDLGGINDLFENHVTQAGRQTPEDLLAELRKVLAPISAAFLLGTPDWAVLAEFSPREGPDAASPRSEPNVAHYGLQIDRRQLALRVLFSNRTNAAWQDEVCRSFLLLLALNTSIHQADRVDGEQPRAGGLQHDDVWSEFVGLQLRAHLDSYTEQCRYADSVLILGETGAGKELAARSLHRLWKRKGELVALNCAALPGDLLDAELFGIEAGAATGVTGREGRLEQAKGGTLFLDEISEMPIQLQGKLLRVLQEKTYFKVGSSQLRRTDVKIIAASNRDERHLRTGGHMRPDLYFRLAQAVVALPPLRSRTQDLAALCGHFLNQLEQKHRRGVAGLSRFALQQMKAYSWPGNIRELQNVLHSMYAKTQPGALIQGADLPDELYEAPMIEAAGKLETGVKTLQREMVRREIDRAGSISSAAKTLGISESYLHRMIKKFRLREPEGAVSSATNARES